MKKFLTVWLLWLSVAANAQCLNDICLTDSVVCVGQTVRVASTPGGLDASFDFGGDALVLLGNAVAPPVDTVYNQPGIYYVTQLAGNVFNQRQVYVLPRPTPAARVAPCGQDNAVRVLLADTVAAPFTVRNRFPGLRLPSTNPQLGNPVALTDSVTLFYARYRIDFGDGQPPTVVESRDTAVVYAYDVPGTYTITVTGEYTDTQATPGFPPVVACGGSATFVVDTTVPLDDPVVSRVETLDTAAGTVRVTYRRRQDLRYVLQANGQPVRTLDAAGAPASVEESLTLTGLDFDDCLRLSTAEVCTGDRRSAPLCPTRLRATAEGATGVVRLSWPPYPLPDRVEGFALTRDGEPLVALSNPNATRYADTAVVCNETYTYRLRVLLAEGEVISNADTALAATDATPPPVPNLFSTIEDGRAALRWRSPPGEVAAYVLTRTGITTEIFTPTPATDSFADGRELFEPVCFTLAYEDACRNRTDSAARTCPIYLEGITEPDGSRALSWTEYVGAPGPPLAYAVEKVGPAGNVYAEIPLDSLTTFYLDAEPDTVSQLLRYRVRADLSGGGVTYSNVVSQPQPAPLRFPDIFTPNQDGLNDTFRGYGRFVDAFRLLVFARSGQLVYEGRDFATGWDGNFGGSPAPAGVYVWRATGRDENGSNIEMSGTVTLIR